MGDGTRSGSSGDTEVDVPLDVIPLHSTNLLTVLDESGTVRYESPSIERIFGFDPDELVGEPVADYFHPDDRERVLEAFESVVAGEEGTVEAVEYRHERADGSYRWVESVGSSNPTAQGHYVVNTRDVSERKAREQTLERSVERLDDFASVVSHDLRNPLNVAQGRLAQARAAGDSEYLDAVADAHDRMAALIDDLLTLARTGRPVEAVEPVDLATLAETSWRTVATAEADLVVDVEGPILADRSRLRQLLENLVRNAVEHGGDGVTVTVGELDDRAGFYVADDGPGIPADSREQVFERGYSTREDGTGFGLVIVEEVVDAHGWSLALTESRAGGARFEVTGVEYG